MNPDDKDRMEQNQTAFWLGRVVGLIMILVGVGTGGILLLESRQTPVAEWPRVQAVIYSSELGQYRARRGKYQGFITMYEADLKFAYVIDETVHKSDLFKIDEDRFHGSDRAQIASFVNDYPRGKNFQAYLNPDDPTIAVIEPATGHGTRVAKMMAGVGVVGGLFMLMCSECAREQIIEMEARNRNLNQAYGVTQYY